MQFLFFEHFVEYEKLTSVLRVLNIRIFECDTCDNILDRDLNASINIKRVGTSTLAGEIVKATSIA
ncbi:zinc ribbon domain-containing protein [Arcobacter sp. YIC-464]|uniref:zinc ribbon domain-containing protein n=1 Tax=Arcobacter sp. YIC-464 TaxID=3376631 RepID=UPI003C144596